MAGRRRSAAQLARDRKVTANLYLQGWLQVDIAEELGIHQSAVSRDLKWLHKEWLAAALLDTDKLKANELAKIDRLELEYWLGWVRSCEDAETVVQKVVAPAGKGGEGGGRGETTRTAKGQAGDTKYLMGVERCIERRCKILGIDAPLRAELKQDIKHVYASFETAGQKVYGDDYTAPGSVDEHGN